MKAITSFTGKYRFLSNFYPVSAYFDGVNYPTAEHAYVAAKTLDIDKRKEIQAIETPGNVKRFGRSLSLRADWDNIKIDVMRQILKTKFCVYRSDTQVLAWLLATYPAELVEGNTWGDTFWGQSPVGYGQNILGKLLMEIRNEGLRSDKN
jgi:ribA/ribD-fused uncharacterized protein